MNFKSLKSAIVITSLFLSGYAYSDEISEKIEKDLAADYSIPFTLSTLENGIGTINFEKIKKITKIKSNDNYTEFLLEGSFKNDLTPKNYDLLPMDNSINSIDIFFVDDNEAYLKVHHKIKVESKLEKNFDGTKIIFEPIKASNLDSLTSSIAFSDQLIDLDFNNADTRKVIQILANTLGENVIIHDDVEGELSINLIQVSARDAMSRILELKGLQLEKVGSVSLIAPTKLMVELKNLHLDYKERSETLANISSIIVPLRYSKAKNTANILEPLLSSRGKIIVDERTNTFVARDIPVKLNEIKKLLVEIDTPVKQVEIEARIVITKKISGKNIGMKWGLSDSSSDGDRSIDLNSVLGGALFGGDSTLIKLGTDILDWQLSAMESSDIGKVLHRPVILATSNNESIINSGSQVPYLELSDTGLATVAFKDVLLNLTVLPQVTDDNNIVLKLDLDHDSVGEMTSSGPSIDKNSISTTVVVADGETVSLGRVIKTTDINGSYTVPYLSDLPVLGSLFKSKQSQLEEFELMIFVTPKILGFD